MKKADFLAKLRLKPTSKSNRDSTLDTGFALSYILYDADRLATDLAV
jgi:hypothetical protein